jgi:hypothetical protein
VITMTNLPIPDDLFARAQIIVGLRKLADYLEDHPDLPVPEFGGDVTFYPRGDDEQRRAEVDRIADILGVKPTDDTRRDGHYRAIKSFGRMTYRAVHIPSRSWARYQARDSYRANITLDDQDGPEQQKDVAA